MKTKMQPIKINPDGYIPYEGHLFAIPHYADETKSVAKVRSLCRREINWLSSIEKLEPAETVLVSCLDCLLALLRMLAATGKTDRAIELYQQLLQSPEHFAAMKDRDLFEGDL